VSDEKGGPTVRPPRPDQEFSGYDVETTAIRGSLRRRPHLFVVAGTHSVGLVIPVRNGMILGRAPESDVCVGERGVSHKHCRFSVGSFGEVYIEDLGSTNGTSRPGTPERIVGPTLMREGERFKIGDLGLVFINVDDRADDLGDTLRRNLLRSAIEDAETRLLSGAPLLDAVGRQFRFAERTHTALTAMMLQVEPLDEIRSKFGASAVGFVLRRVAAMMSVGSLLSQDTVVGLYRDQRLVVVLPGATVENANATAEWIRSRVNDAKVIYEGQLIPFVVHVGWASSTESPEALIQSALDAVTRAHRATVSSS
jgi:GGDEF domain-containing protein